MPQEIWSAFSDLISQNAVKSNSINVLMSKRNSTAHKTLKTGTSLLKTEQAVSWYIQVTALLPPNINANFKV